MALPSQSADSVESSFAEVVGLIEQARQRAYQAVNSELVGLYWRIGEYISVVDDNYLGRAVKIVDAGHQRQVGRCCLGRGRGG